MKYFLHVGALELVVVHFRMNMMIYGLEYFYVDNNTKVLFLKIRGI